MKVSEAKAIANVSTGNTKMPGTTFAIDAFACQTGSRLAEVPGTPCHTCYARRLQRIRPSVDKGWRANLEKWRNSTPEEWEAAVIFQILRYNTDGFHRWFDSGDLQSVQMLASIVSVARATPGVRHWLPTQERRIVRDYLRSGGSFPDNLVVRVSAARIDTAIHGWAHTSNVVTSDEYVTGTKCMARTRGNVCGPCRACWDVTVRNVSYPKH